MSNELNNIDQRLREQLDGFEMTPPTDVWTKTEAAIAAGRSKRRFYGWFFLGSILIALLTIGIFSLNNPAVPSSKLNQQKSLAEKSDSNKKQTGRGDRSEEINLLEDGSFKTNVSKGELGTFNSSVKKSNGNTLQNAEANSSNIQFDPSVHGTSPKGENSSAQLDRSSKQGQDVRLPLFDKNSEQLYKNNTTSLLTESQYLNTNILPLRSFAYFKSASGTLIDPSIEEDSLPALIPFWKSLSFEASFGMSTFSIVPSKQTTEPEFASLLMNASTGRLGYDGRLGINYHFSPVISFQTGLEYSYSKENYAYTKAEISTYSYMDTVSFSIDSVTMDTTYVINSVSYDSTTISSHEDKNTYLFLSIPFHFAWHQQIGVRGELEVAIGGAISLYGRNSGAVIADANNFVLSSQEGYHVSGMFSVGGSLKYLHHLNDRHAVYIQPWARFGVTNQSTPSLPYETFRNSYGLRFGYRFYL